MSAYFYLTSDETRQFNSGGVNLDLLNNRKWKFEKRGNQLMIPSIVLDALMENRPLEITMSKRKPKGGKGGRC